MKYPDYHEPPKGDSKKQQLLIDFLEVCGGPAADKVVFRPGASFTCGFGLTQRYKVINGETVWGYPGIHKGVDRGGSQKLYQDKKNGIWAPFEFSASDYVDWEGKVYGTDVWLIHELGFRIRICHMYPESIKILKTLQAGEPVKMGEYIGPIGSNGFSTGAHSHTELDIPDKNNVDARFVLESILQMRYGDEASRSFDEEEIVDIYHECPHTSDWSEKACIQDFEEIMETKGIEFINPYKIVQKDGRVLYSTRMMFGL